MKKKKLGRPIVGASKATERMPMVRLTPEQLQAYKDAAQLDGVSMSAWVKTNLDRIAKRKLKQ